MKKPIVAGLLAVTLLGTGAGLSTAFAGSSNDTVLSEDDYDEYFKKEGRNKNYLYTVTSFERDGVFCIALTGASETTVDVECDFDGARNR